jgi:uncharacterized protein YihD (DUF1040 family)
MSNIKTEYQGFTVLYDEFNNQWLVEAFERNYQSLTKAKEAIDRDIRQNNKIEPIPTIQASYDEEYSRCEITSFVSAKRVWTRKRGGKGRGQIHDISDYHPLYQETPENWKRIEKIEALKKRIDELQRLRDDEQKKLLRLDTTELYKKFTEETGLSEKGEQ